jgi:hypothetical protein
LSSPDVRLTIEPSASTASSPATRARTVPWRTARTPPASQATSPPTVALSRAAKIDARVEPGRPRLPLQRGERHAGAGVHLQRRAVDLAEAGEDG